ncbi:MAG: hypothetical protein OHK0046_29960 [Anaerolineae bacterium]
MDRTALIERLQEFIQQEMVRYEVPGVALALVSREDMLLATGYGLRDRDANLPVTPQTRFRVGSTNKSMTTMLAAVLVDEGVLAWDQRAVSIYPKFQLSDAALTQSATIRDLFSMRLGLQDTSFILRCSETIARRLFEFLPEIPVVAAPGEKFIYHDDLFAAGGLLAAMATGVPLSEAMDAYMTLMYDRVLMPIGMQQATFVADLAMACSDASRSYVRNAVTGMLEPTTYTDIGALLPSGGVAASVTDMALYLMTHLNGGTAPNGRRVVRSAALQETYTPNMTIQPGVTYGMGWGQLPGGLIWHNGGLDGFRTDIAFMPEQNLGIALLANAGSGIFFNQAVLKALTDLLSDETPDASSYWHAYQQMLDALAQKPEGDTDMDHTPYLGNYEHYMRLRQQPDGSLWFSTWGTESQVLPLAPGTYILGMHGDYVRIQVTDGVLRFYDMQTNEPLYGGYARLPA